MLPRPHTADLDEDLQVLQVFAIPFVKRLKKLQALAGGAHIHSLPTAVLGRVLVGVLPRVELLQGDGDRDALGLVESSVPSRTEGEPPRPRQIQLS